MRPTTCLGHYFPTLASLELTETAVALFLIGIPILLLRARSGAISQQVAGQLGAWIVVPMAALMLSAIAVYDNIRHMLFILPPILLLAGIGLDAILARLRKRWATTVVILLVIAPGVLGILSRIGLRREKTTFSILRGYSETCLMARAVFNTLPQTRRGLSISG